jgi:acyl-CoA reductase-like NAD-dependent aldehyde dehydrogenase
VRALRAAGFSDDHIVMLPTDYVAADEILRHADLSMVYGGDVVVREYAANTTVSTQGPGRSKILLTAEVDWRDHLDTIVNSVSHHSGVACINATAVFTEGDPAPLAEAIAGRLTAIPTLPPDDDRAVLLVQPLDTARAVEQYLLAQTIGTTPWLVGTGIVDELSDSSAVLRPAVHELDRPDAKQAAIELPFPCVWVVPWTLDAGIAPPGQRRTGRQVARRTHHQQRLPRRPPHLLDQAGRTPRQLSRRVPHAHQDPYSQLNRPCTITGLSPR